MGKNYVILAVAGCLLWFGAAIVRLERYHYAAQIGMCADGDPAARDACLNRAETRTNWVYHLAYGLKLL